jgi:hypothetical protein
MDEENNNYNLGHQRIVDPIDKMTFELLVNKTQYQKYLAKTDPLKHQEHLDYLEEIRTYKDRILSLTSELLDDPDKQVTLEINEGFSSYVKTMMKYLQLKDLEMEGCYHGQESDDADILFLDKSMGKGTGKGTASRVPTSSYWGKHITKEESY